MIEPLPAAEDVLRDFAGPPADWNEERLDRLLAAAPHREIDRLATLGLSQPSKSATWLDPVFAWLTDAGWDAAIAEAVRIWSAAAALGEAADPPPEAVESLFAHASLQYPHKLRPHLGLLWDCPPNGDAYDAAWPWRGGDAAAAERLEAVVRGPDDPDSPYGPGARQEAWERLLEIPDGDVLRRAASLGPTAVEDPDWRARFLRLAGRDPADLSRLHASGAWHLTYPPGHRKGDRDRAEDGGPPQHPTWRQPEVGIEVTVGGPGSGTCGLCGGGTHRLVELPAGFVFFHQAADPREPVSIETCLSCVGWEREALFFDHPEGGPPRPRDVGEIQPQWPAGPLAEVAARLAPSPRRWRTQDWGNANGAENLHRVGGRPCWVQDADYPDCPECGRLMRFVCQFDSDLPTADGGEWMWGSGGLGYAFACGQCRVTASLWQCT